MKPEFIEEAGRSKHKQILGKFRCECGNIFVTRPRYVALGIRKSCGCYRPSTGPTVKSHPLYNTWKEMRRRCNSPDSIAYCNYGARGISICKRWDEFSNFLADMEAGHKPGLTLERINNNRGYSKRNCKWATRREQSRNKRNNKNFLYKGVRYCLKDLSQHLGINYDTMKDRLRSGRSFEEVISPIKLPKQID